MSSDKAAAKTDEKRTNLSVPAALKERVERQCGKDRRPYKAELLVLVEEALDAREKRK